MSKTVRSYRILEINSIEMVKEEKRAVKMFDKESLNPGYCPYSILSDLTFKVYKGCLSSCLIDSKVPTFLDKRS